MPTAKLPRPRRQALRHLRWLRLAEKLGIFPSTPYATFRLGYHLEISVIIGNTKNPCGAHMGARQIVSSLFYKEFLENPGAYKGAET